MEQKENMPERLEMEVVDDVHRTAGVAPRQRTTILIILFSLYIGLAGWIYNFDLSYGGFVLVMAPFSKDFGTCVTKPNAAGVATTTCTLTALQQSLVSLTFLFVALGGAVAGFTGHFLGRRGTIQVGCVFVAIGAGGMLGTTGNYTAYIVCKCIGGVGMGHFIAAAPTYGVECTPPHARGLLSSLFNFGLALGAVVAAAVCVGSSHYTSSLAWQIPIICQIPLSLILGLGAMVFPESPRWLLVRGREEKARRSFARLNNLNPADEEVTRQIEEVQRYIELETALEKTTSWLEIFRGNDRRRTWVSVLVGLAQALCGGKFMSAYGSIFLAGVGISNPLVITLILTSCALAGAFATPFLIEYGGRRFSLLLGYSFMGILMLIIAVIGNTAGATNDSVKSAFVALLCIWQFIFGSCVSAGIAITAPEMHSVRLRTYGTAFVAMLYEIASFASAFYTPYMLGAQYGNMGLNVGYFYFGLTAIILVLVFLFVPETAQLSLEQVDDYFLSGKKAWQTSTRLNRKISKEQAVHQTGEKNLREDAEP